MSSSPELMVLGLADNLTTPLSTLISDENVSTTATALYTTLFSMSLNSSRNNSDDINLYSFTHDGFPIRDPLYIVIPFTVIYSIIFVTGLLGNIITCIVISRNKSMHTATNYYLFSLAVSDLLLLISGE